MKIRYATVRVSIGAPYNRNLTKSFKVREGEGYMRQGLQLGRVMLAQFIENHIANPREKDYRYIESISEIKVTRFSV